MMMMITVTMMKMPSLMSMRIRKGFAAEYCHPDEHDADDADVGVDADDDDGDNDAEVDGDTERICS